MVLVAEYSDPAKSGAEVVNRPGFQSMLRAARSNPRPFDVILARDQARFGRSLQDGVIRAELRELGIAIDNVSSPSGDAFGQLTLASEMTETIQDAVNINFRKTQARLMIQGMEAKARKGGFTGAQATCYGYKQDWVPPQNGSKPVRKPVPDKHKARIVREIFRRYVAGDSLKALSRWLNESGIEAPRGVAWYDSTVRAILKNETYLGRLVYGRVKKVKHPVTRTPMNTYRDDSEVIRVDGAFAAIIDQKTFNAAQAILSRNERTRPEGGNPRNTLQGIGKCSVCGWHLAFQKHSQNERWYYMCGHVKQHKSKGSDSRCTGILYGEYVDEVVALFLRRILDTKVTDIRAQVAQYNAAAQNLTGLSATESLEIAIREQEAAADRLGDSIARMGGSTTLHKKLETAESKLAELRRQRDQIAAAVHVPSVDAEEVLDARSQIKDALRKNDTEQMRSILSAVCSTVTLDWSQRNNPRVAFNYRFEDLREPIQVKMTNREEREWRKVLMSGGHFPRMNDGSNALDYDNLPDVDLLAPAPYRVHITVTGAPLTFVPKWSITNAEKATEEAVARIAEALKA